MNTFALRAYRFSCLEIDRSPTRPHAIGAMQALLVTRAWRRNSEQEVSYDNLSDRLDLRYHRNSPILH